MSINATARAESSTRRARRLNRTGAIGYASPCGRVRRAHREEPSTMIFRSPYPDVAIPDVSYPEFILKRAGEHADQPLLVDGPSGRALSGPQVAGGARRVASALARRGFGKGEVFAIYSPNLPEYAFAFHG